MLQLQIISQVGMTLQLWPKAGRSWTLRLRMISLNKKTLRKYIRNIEFIWDNFYQFLIYQCHFMNKAVHNSKSQKHIAKVFKNDA